jgi:two-component system sensor histidine kinase KdpD
MKRFLQSSGRAVVMGSCTWATAALLFRLHSNRSIACLVLVLEVLAGAALGDWPAAVLTSVFATLAISWYFIDVVDSFTITSWGGAFTFVTMLLTSITGSTLAIRAQRRADEAIRRREEMERLHQLGNGLLASGSVSEAARNIVSQVVQWFGLQGAELRLAGWEPVVAGSVAGELRCTVSAGPEALVLFGEAPSQEVQRALANLVTLVLDRARSAEERGRTEASQRGEELRNAMLNALAHDFKTPLTSIKAASSMLCSSLGLGAGPDRELAVVIDEEADRLELLIQESLNLARIDAHQQDPRVEECSVGRIAEAVRVRVSRYLGARQFAVNIPDDLPALHGDRFLFEQMLMQVVDNAWKYSKPDSRIELSAAELDSAVVISVRNQGSAIPEEERVKIFGKFYRGAATRTRVEGTGLGLAIARRIAEAHGGSLWLGDDPEGPTFRFRIPAGIKGEANDTEQNDFAHRRRATNP